MSASNSRQKISKKKLIIVSIIVLLTVVVSSVLTVVTKKLSYDNIYEGVYIGKTDVSGMSKDDLKNELSDLFNFSDVYDITISIDGVSDTISTLTLSPALDVEGMVNTAFSYGRQEKGLSRLGEISNLKKNPVYIPYSVTIDEFSLQKVLDRISQGLEITATDNKIEVGDDSITITRGTSGKGYLYEDIKKGLTDCLLNEKKEVSLNLRDIEPEEITVDFIKRHTKKEPTEATYTISDHRLIVTESSSGVTFDEKEVARLLKEEKNSSVIVIPAKVKHPEMTTEMINEKILAHKLGTFSSDFSSSSNDRAHNIELACSKINGYVLAPGEEFSYNDVVGPRTVETGFRVANVYVGNTVQPGIGGGICQVSSTMFNAVVLADLEVTSRRNHTLPVSYVPMGRDATVSYGSVDFKFKNNTSNPIEIHAECVGRKNVITIYGTDEHPEREIKIETQKTGTSAPNVVRKEDPTLLEGEIKVESEGTSGSSYIAYKVVYENGEKVSSDVLCRSTYKGKDRVEIVGTKKGELSPAPTDTPNEDPVPEPTPLPEAPPSSTPEPENSEIGEDNV